jgi:hypothetical protein
MVVTAHCVQSIGANSFGIGSGSAGDQQPGDFGTTIVDVLSRSISSSFSGTRRTSLLSGMHTASRVRKPQALARRLERLGIWLLIPVQDIKLIPMATLKP